MLVSLDHRSQSLYTGRVSKSATDHCIDLLRQVLMCNSATGLLFYTDLGKQQPEARVSTEHMCKNFSQISDWVWKHDSELGVVAESAN